MIACDGTTMSDTHDRRPIQQIACPPITREHYIEIYGGGNYQRGLAWLREEGLYVVRAEGGLGWKTERKPEQPRTSDATDERSNACASEAK